MEQALWHQRNGQELIQGIPPGHEEELPWQCPALNREQRGAGVSFLGRFGAVWTQSCALCPGMALLEQGGGTRWTHFGPSHPDPSWDSVLSSLRRAWHCSPIPRSMLKNFKIYIYVYKHTYITICNIHLLLQNIHGRIRFQTTRGTKGVPSPTWYLMYKNKTKK